MYQFNREEYEKRMQWFVNARFGMFIHWGLYAVPAKGEWYASIGRVPPERYEEYLRTFDPVDYDPRAWARLARQAGMKYAVLTAKHHEGFCLFDSAYTDYKIRSFRYAQFSRFFERLKRGIFLNLIKYGVSYTYGIERIGYVI